MTICNYISKDIFTYFQKFSAKINEGITLIKQVRMYGPNFQSKGHSVRQNSQKGVFGWEVRFYTTKGAFRWRNSKQNVYCYKFEWKFVKNFVFTWTNLLFLYQQNKKWGHWVTNLSFLIKISQSMRCLGDRAKFLRGPWGGVNWKGNLKSLTKRTFEYRSVPGKSIDHNIFPSSAAINLHQKVLAWF